MTRNVAVDANAILRYVLGEQEQFYPQSKLFFEQIEQGEISAWLDPVTLAEVIWTLKSFYRLDIDSICQGLLPIIKLPHLFMIEKDRYLSVMALYPITRNFGDACACALALQACEGRLFSFDRKLGKVPSVQRLEAP